VVRTVLEDGRGGEIADRRAAPGQRVDLVDAGSDLPAHVPGAGFQQVTAARTLRTPAVAQTWVERDVHRTATAR
jgi:hypothetical protein